MELRMKQLVSHGSVIFGITESGSVFWFDGISDGWIPISMKMSDRLERKKEKEDGLTYKEGLGVG